MSTLNELGIKYGCDKFDHVVHDSTNNHRYPFSLSFVNIKPEYGTFIGQRITWEDLEGRI